MEQEIHFDLIARPARRKVAIPKLVPPAPNEPIDESVGRKKRRILPMLRAIWKPRLKAS